MKVHCDFCDKDITRQTKILDADGLDTDMCINCFLNGEENQKHSKDNPYHVINKLTFPMFEETWSAEEELLLLEGLEKFGFGNWNDIGEHIGTDKTGEEVMHHYERIYLRTDDFLPPDDVLSKRDKQNNLVVKQMSNKGSRGDEIDMRKKKYGKQGLDKKDLGVGGTASGQQSIGGLTQSKDSNMNASEIIGFMPLRGDFDYEYDNEAELFLAEMEFNGKDLFLNFFE